MIHAQIEFHNVDISTAAARADIGAGSGGVLPARAMRDFFEKIKILSLTTRHVCGIMGIEGENLCTTRCG